MTIEELAALAAQHVNGGKFDDGDFYSPEHRKKWLEAVWIVLEGAQRADIDRERRDIHSHALGAWDPF